MAYRFTRLIIRLLIRLIAKVEIQGLEKLDLNQSYIIAGNHLGRLDPGIVYTAIDRQDILMLVAEKYRANPISRFLVKSLNLLFVDRFNADLVALRACLGHLKQGGVAFLAPEGTRSPTASLQEGRPGTSYLAWKAGVPIIPVGVFGSEDRLILSNMRHLRRSKITVKVGEPIPPPAVDARGPVRDEILEQFTTEIMCQIASLLPPEYRGIYSDHPRLREILNNRAQIDAQAEASI